MVHTVALNGINGNVGTPTFKLLIEAANQGKIKLVAFHRAGSKPKDITLGNNAEYRELDGEKESVDDIVPKVQDVHVYISTMGGAAAGAEANIVDALAKAKDFVTYIPNVYSTTWNEADFKDPYLGPIVNHLHQGWNKAKAHGLGVTPVYSGGFDLFVFGYGFVGSPIKANLITASKEHLSNKVPITAINHLAQALSRLAVQDPQNIKNKSYSVVTFWPTGQELVDLYTKIHNQPTKVVPITDELLESKQKDAANLGPIKVGYWKKWAANSFEYESNGNISDKQYDGPGLEEVVRSFL